MASSSEVLIELTAATRFATVEVTVYNGNNNCEISVIIIRLKIMLRCVIVPTSVMEKKNLNIGTPYYLDAKNMRIKRREWHVKWIVLSGAYYYNLYY